jgi:hypothetical protein
MSRVTRCHVGKAAGSRPPAGFLEVGLDMVASGEINARTGDGGEVLFSSKPL